MRGRNGAGRIQAIAARLNVEARYLPGELSANCLTRIPSKTPRPSGAQASPRANRQCVRVARCDASIIPRRPFECIERILR